MHACFNLAEIWYTYWDLKAHTSIKFGVNVINIQGDFKHKTKLNFCQVDRVNASKEQAENQYVARLNIRGVPFGS